MLLQGLGVSCNSVNIISRTNDMGLRDCYSIARSISETSINIAYIVASGEAVAERAWRHAHQKTFRDLSRSGKIGNLRFETKHESVPDPKTIPGLEDALQEFTRSNGKEERDWTKDNLDTRLKVIDEKYPKDCVFLVGSVAQIYRHSSEILHGTLFGSAYFWQPYGFTGDTRLDYDRSILLNHYTAVYSSCLMAVIGLISILSSRFECSGIAEANSVLLRRYKDFMEHDMDLYLGESPQQRSSAQVTR